MKILEAWARGVPVVATPEAVAGLEAVHGREVLVGQDGAELAAAIARLHREPTLARALVEAGRRTLVARHAPAAVAAALAAVYTEVSGRATGRR
jgi:glycosyltransferase involved in cell wall biosynthesis